MGWVVRGAASLALVAGAPELNGQIPRTRYYEHVPPAPRLVSQTRASDQLHLFGDRSLLTYRDVAPRDGIDDLRAIRLLDLAERFSPILRRNNFSLPQDFRRIPSSGLVMQVDRWVDGELHSADSVELRCCASPSRANVSDMSGAALDDLKLVALLKAFDPRLSEPRVIEAGAREETILYFDFPGADEKTWRRAYKDLDPRASTIFVHPFIHDDESGSERPFALVLQFWFFYPFNDSANNHEGDWEHLNVAITTCESVMRDRALDGARGGLSADEIQQLLNAERGVPLDSLAIRYVTYYFHQQAMVLDYLAEPVSHDSPKNGVSGRLTSAIWEDADFISNSLRRRLAIAGGRLATHPIGYIGGNSRGLDELLTLRPRFGGSYNRNSHGTYPFPATWRAVGPIGASEKVHGDITPPIRTRGRDGSDSIAWHDLIEDDRYASYQRGSINLIPDWERVVDAMVDDAAVRREWAWLVLPVHFGYPASKSPGGGAVSRTDLGDVSPTGPAFDPGWNRPFFSTEYHSFDPHVLRIAFAPVSPFTGLQNGWGVFNVPIALAGLIPGMQVMTAQLMPWSTGALGILGAPPGKTFYAGKLPNRFTSFGAGRFVQFGGDDFARLLPRSDDDSVATLLLRGAHIDGKSYRRHSSDGNRIWLLLHYGDGFAIENTFSVDTTTLQYSIRDSAGHAVASVRGQLAMRQLSSGIRFSRRVLADELRGYVRAGYTWAWYSVAHATLNDRPVASPTTRGGHTLSLIPSTKWWPNSSYAGVGLEVFAPRRAWVFGRLGYGVAAELNLIAFPMRGRGCRCLLKPGDGALSLVFGW